MSDEGKLFIGGLSFETNEESLADAFGKYGTIEKGRFKSGFTAARTSFGPRCMRSNGFCEIKTFIETCFYSFLVDVIRDKETGRSRGFGFVKYDNIEDAKDAMTAMNGKVCKHFHSSSWVTKTTIEVYAISQCFFLN